MTNTATLNTCASALGSLRPKKSQRERERGRETERQRQTERGGSEGGRGMKQCLLPFLED